MDASDLIKSLPKSLARRGPSAYGAEGPEFLTKAWIKVTPPSCRLLQADSEWPALIFDKASPPFRRRTVAFTAHNFFVFDRAPQAINEDIVHKAAASIHRSRHAGGFELAGEGGAGELHALTRWMSRNREASTAFGTAKAAWRAIKLEAVREF